MKLKKITILILILIVSNAFSQTSMVTYRVESMKQDHLDSPRVIAINKELPLKTFTLKYNKYHSFFSQNKNIPINKLYSGLANIIIGANKNWFQNIIANQAVIEKEIKGELFNVNYDNMIGWKLSDETKIIENYVCYKAVRKQLNKRTTVGKVKKYIVYEAWYTPDIPVAFGPAGNGGLPGLILQLDKKNVARYTAKKIMLNKKKNIKIPRPKASTNITVDEMVKLMRKARKVTVD